jgi:alpha-methylacyl-CoA racemase
MMLADFGADVISVTRLSAPEVDPAKGMTRGKLIIGVNLRDPRGCDLVRSLADSADIFLEGFRPGVMERLELGPEQLMARNGRLIYGRLTGWGQTGPYAHRAGHDINYLAVSGILGASGVDQPQAPPAFLGDLANGSYLMVAGLMMALFERERSGRGQVIDAAIVDGASFMLTPLLGELAAGRWNGTRGTHTLSGAAPFYGTYRCADGGWFAVGAIEPQFYKEFLRILGLTDVDPSVDAQMDGRLWPALRERVRAIFLSRSRNEWAAEFSRADACGTPVLEIQELANDPHLKARATLKSGDRGLTTAPAPRLSGHPSMDRPKGPGAQAGLAHALSRADISMSRIEELTAAGVVDVGF